ncbi:MAG: S24/S26 family peptidase [Coriobacteriia bacterium]|nr:S24/S26 family peptidase [Coriobacteriia bacterium]
MLERLNQALPMVVAYILVAVLVVVGSREYIPVAVTGGSMRPALAHGDLVIFRRGAGVRQGDIVLAVSPGHGPVVHRVDRVMPDEGVRLRGDANPVVDASATPRTCVRGRAVLVVPVGSTLERWRGDGDSATISAQSNSARR